MKVKGGSESTIHITMSPFLFFFVVVGELRFITLVGPEELTLQPLSPEQRGYSFSSSVSLLYELPNGQLRLNMQ